MKNIFLKLYSYFMAIPIYSFHRIFPQTLTTVQSHWSRHLGDAADNKGHKW